MTKFRLINALRKEPWFPLIMRELEAWGCDDWEILPPTGRGHPKMVIRFKGQVMKTPVPGSAHGHSDQKYLVARVRKFLAAAQRIGPQPDRA
jgi:hypothetical protein